MRSRSAQALTDSILRELPGATVWGKGDLAHQSSPSDHNEDDTAGSMPEQTDTDTLPEHRALDVPLLGPVTMSKLQAIRQRLVERPANARRLRYVILERTIWRKSAGWRAEWYGGEFHNHLHVSVDAADDDNAAPYDLAVAPVPVPPVRVRGEIMPKLARWSERGEVFVTFADGTCRWVRTGQEVDSLKVLWETGEVRVLTSPAAVGRIRGTVPPGWPDNELMPEPVDGVGAP